MPFKKGQSGNPGGRSKDQPFKTALNMQLKAIGDDDQRGLRKIAQNLIDQAEVGEPWAIKEIADRLDGKPAQTIDTTIEEKPSLAAAATAELLERAASLVERIEGHADGTAEEAEGEGDDSGVRSVH